MMSLSTWCNEKALVRWRTRAKHYDVKAKSRFEIFRDYHVRVAQVTRGTRLPAGYALYQQRLDATDTGVGPVVTLIDASRPPKWIEKASAERVAEWLGLVPEVSGLVAWDVRRDR